MAVPHLDTRMLDGRRMLLFGPFAAWTTKFLRTTGSWTDLPHSVRTDNIRTLCKVAIDNLDLVRYLYQQGTQSMADRMNLLRVLYPSAKPEDWRLVDAGIRVQAIKKTDAEAGIVHYGTEVVTNVERNISALLGASPGASVSVSIALDVIKNCMPNLIGSATGRDRLQSMIPNYFYDATQPACAGRCSDISSHSDAVLQLN
jgi:malate dehydrogenase (quinone)